MELRDGYQFTSTKQGQMKLKPEQQLMLLTQETRQGLCITSKLVHNTYYCYYNVCIPGKSFIELVEYLFKNIPDIEFFKQ